MYGKLIDGSLVYAPKNIIVNNVKYIPATEEALVQAGYKELQFTSVPKTEENYHAIPSWEEHDNAIVQIWEIVEDSPQEIVERLKRQLDETDYKIIKCSEYALAGLESPYDIEVLHAERQTLRDRINEMENSL